MDKYQFINKHFVDKDPKDFTFENYHNKAIKANVSPKEIYQNFKSTYVNGYEYNGYIRKPHDKVIFIPFYNEKTDHLFYISAICSQDWERCLKQYGNKCWQMIHFTKLSPYVIDSNEYKYVYNKSTGKYDLYEYKSVLKYARKLSSSYLKIDEIKKTALICDDIQEVLKDYNTKYQNKLYPKLDHKNYHTFIRIPYYSTKTETYHVIDAYIYDEGNAYRSFSDFSLSDSYDKYGGYVN